MITAKEAKKLSEETKYKHEYIDKIIQLNAYYGRNFADISIKTILDRDLGFDDVIYYAAIKKMLQALGYNVQTIENCICRITW